MSGTDTVLREHLSWVSPYRNHDFAGDVPSGEPEARSLSPSEITALESSGCVSDNWSRVRVHPEFDPQGIAGSRFIGDCYLGKFSPDGEAPHGPQGIFNCMIANCSIASSVFLSGVSWLSGYVVGSGARLIGCGMVEAAHGAIAGLPESTFSPGNETGGREIPLIPGLTREQVTAALSGREGARTRKTLAGTAAILADVFRSLPGIISPGVRISGCSSIANVLFGPGAVVNGAAALELSIVDSRSGSPVTVGPGVILRRAVLSPGACADSHAVIESSILSVNTHTGTHAAVRGSWIGEGSEVGGGEVTSSFMGPYIAMHHQSLLIAALWPDGRGNIGYGANLGSNHTGRAPDQEILIGEGCFFGLSSSVKYPADFSAAPGTIVATGTVVPPGRIGFPFSLIIKGTGDAPRIKPGWVWSASAYTLARNRDKLRRRSGMLHPLFSKETVQRTYQALDALLSDEGAGLAGGCVLEGPDIHQAIKGYRELLRFALAEMAVSGDIPDDLAEAVFSLAGVTREELGSPETAASLRRETVMLFADACRRSRARDHERGMGIQPESYGDTHVHPDNDPVLCSLDEELRGI